MKKHVIWILSLLFLNGCSSTTKDLDAGMQLRAKILQSSQCSFTAQITAEYDDRLYQFTVDSKMDQSGDLYFTVIEPETISGISGKLSGSGGEIIFDNQILQFPMMAEDLPSPISAPWILINTLRSGYLSSACNEDDVYRLSMDDSYNGDDYRLDIWLDAEQFPHQADILLDGKRILTMKVSNFVIT